MPNTAYWSFTNEYRQLTGLIGGGDGFELTDGVDPHQRFSKPITGVGKMAKTLKSPEI
jgi:hypothetical protein